jgi:SAM-dependent methyltransferase
MTYPDITKFFNSKNGIAVTLVCPEKYIHSLALLEIAETINYALQNLGFDSILTDSLDSSDRIKIIIGGHLLDQIPNHSIPKESIIYNFEQIDKDSSWLTKSYIDLLKNNKIWDYSMENIRILKQLGIEDITHMPIGHVNQMERISKSQDPDIDILFYGSINDRRKKILDQLKSTGLNIVTIFGIYGADRDALIARSKIVLNIHFYESKIFEIVRISYLLSNGICVVSENGNDEFENQFNSSIFLTNYDDIVNTCFKLLNDPIERKKIATNGQKFFQSLRQEDFLNNIIIKPNKMIIPSNNQAEYLLPFNFPDILNMGSGKDWKEDAFNVDIQQEWNPDAIFDFNKELPAEGICLETIRFGKVLLTENHFDLIYSMDVLEHLDNLIVAMTTCLRLLKVGGIMKINVPYDLSWGAWQDPTHVRAFNEKSWLYYTDWHWYIGWFEHRFDIKSLTYSLSPIGTEMSNQGIDLNLICRTPRAVDSMIVELKKRSLNSDEIKNYHNLRKN